LDRARTWRFAPQVAAGAAVAAGDVLGTVQETASLAHKILVPPGAAGVVAQIRAGDYTVEDEVATLRLAASGELFPVTLLQRWPIRERRPCRRKLDPDMPLISGQRVIDSFFPIARGGTAIIPGGF